MSQTWTSDQPRDGDVVLVCEHDKKRDRYYVYKLTDPDGGACRVNRSDGAEFRAGWLMLCENCHVEALRSNQDAGTFARRDMVWKGDEPSVYQEEVM